MARKGKETKGKRMGGGGRGRPGKSGERHFWNAGRAMVMMFIILGGIVTAGGLAYQSDQLYLQGKTNATSTVPTTIVAGGNQALIVTATDSFGDPMMGEEVKVTLMDDDDREYVLFEGETGESGSVEPIVLVPEDFNGTSGKLIVKTGGETVSRTVTVTEAVEADAGGKIMISTDKPIYQPGQEVRLRTLGFEGSEMLASERKVTIEIMDPEGNKILKKELQPNEFGVAAMDYPLSDQIPSGNYQITAKLGTIAVTNKTLLVKRYVLPKFKIEVDGAKTWYTTDEDVKGTFKVDYFFGKHVQGQISYEARVYRGVWDLVKQEDTVLNDLGELEFEIPAVEYAAGLDLNDGNGYLEINVSVTDTGGHNEKESYLITIAKAPISIVLLSDTNLEGTDSTYTAICRYPTGVPVQDANVTFKVGANTYRKVADERGIATVTFPYNGEKRMTVQVSKGDIIHTEGFDLKPSDGLKVVPDKYFYSLGDEARFNVHYKGDSMTVWAYYDVISNGFTVSTGHLRLTNGKGSFTVPIDRALSPSAEVRVYKIEPDMKVIRDAVAIAVEGLEGINVDVLPDKQTYRPGGEVTIDFKVTDGEGTGAPSILGVNVVDLAVFELSERLVGLDEVFWALNDQYQEPTYQILDYVYKKDSYDLDYDTTTVVPKCKCGASNLQLESSWVGHLENAAVIRQDNVENFWAFMAVVGVAGYLGLIGLSFRFKRAAVGLILLMVIISVGLAGLLIPMIPSQDSIQMNEPGDFIEGVDGVEKGAMEDTGGPGGIMPPPPNPLLGPQDDTARNFAVNLGLENGASETGGSTSTSKPARVRDYFPETWYWNPVLITDENGQASVTLTAPDSITMWGVDAVASTKDAQFGAGEANITVFQDFFVEPDIPVSAVRNDTFPLRVLVYNYLDTDEDITVKLGQDEWFELLDEKDTKVVRVEAESVSSVTFTIQATQVGWNDVSVAASAGAWSDAIIKPMLVEPDGKQLEDIFNGQLEDEDVAEVTLDLDPERVPMSENAYVKLQASMEAVTVDGAEAYIQFVSGCGEQSLSSLNIDILAYAAVVKAGTSTEKMVEYETMVTQGIQHELQYLLKAKNGIGRGIVWFPGDQDVHPWLTSWGLITFQDGRNAGFTIDDKIIKDMQDWLVSQQKDDGSWEFPEWGLYEFNHPTLKSKRTASTAYILRALLYSGYSPNSDVANKATQYIKDHIDEHMDDPYILSVSLIGLEAANADSGTKASISNRIQELRDADPLNSTSSWDSEVNMISDGNDWGWEWGGRGGGSDPHTIETTGYAVMAMEDSGKRTMAEEGVKYLLEHRTGHGYFSTQDTVVAFQALAYAGEANIKDMDISVYAEDVLVDTIHFDRSNKEVTSIVDLRPYLDTVNGSTDIRLESTGLGTLTYQVYLEQYLPWSEENRSAPEELTLDVEYDTLNIKVDDTITATLTMTYTGMAPQLKMLLVELKAPVGFYFVTEDLDALEEAGTIDLYELGPGEASIYIQNVDKDDTLSFSYRLLCQKPVKAQIQGVHVFDMYNPAVDTEVLPVEVVATA